MSKCELDIRLGGGQQRFKPGEEIAGEVRASVDAGCSCKALTLACRWRTHGRGNRAKGPAQEQVLFQGEWRAGERTAYPFRLRAPNGPASYHGTNLNVDWYLQARADIPWAIDPKSEIEFLLEVEDASDTGYSAGPLFKPPRVAHKAQGRGRLVATFVGLAVTAVGLVAGYSMWSDRHLGWGLVFPLLFVAIGLVTFVGSLWNRLAQRKLGKPRVTLTPLTPAPGETVQVKVDLEPGATVALNAIWVKLVGWEEVVRGSGSNRRTYRQTLHQESIAANIGNPTVQAGERRQAGARIHIPANAPYSFDASDNHLKWSVEVHIDVEAWPDWRETFAIAVLPPGARPAAAAR